MLGGNPEFVPRKAEVSSEESRSLHRGKSEAGFFGPSACSGTEKCGSEIFLFCRSSSARLLPEGRKNGLQGRTLLGLAKRQSRARQAQGPCAWLDHPYLEDFVRLRTKSPTQVGSLFYLFHQKISNLVKISGFEPEIGRKTAKYLEASEILRTFAVQLRRKGD